MVKLIFQKAFITEAKSIKKLGIQPHEQVFLAQKRQNLKQIL